MARRSLPKKELQSDLTFVELLLTIVTIASDVEIDAAISSLPSTGQAGEEEDRAWIIFSRSKG